MTPTIPTIATDPTIVPTRDPLLPPPITPRPLDTPEPPVPPTRPLPDLPDEPVPMPAPTDPPLPEPGDPVG